MLFVTYALLLLAAIVVIVAFGQVGWMLTSYWRAKNPHVWDDVGQVAATVCWPAVLLILHVIVPLLSAFFRLVAMPQRRIAARKKRREEQAHVLRYEREKEREKASEAEIRRATEAATSPAVEIAKINDELVKLSARKAELERRPDSNRH
jgi:hypothetical protein